MMPSFMRRSGCEPPCQAGVCTSDCALAMRLLPFTMLWMLAVSFSQSLSQMPREEQQIPATRLQFGGCPPERCQLKLGILDDIQIGKAPMDLQGIAPKHRTDVPYPVTDRNDVVSGL